MISKTVFHTLIWFFLIYVLSNDVGHVQLIDPNVPDIHPMMIFALWVMALIAYGAFDGICYFKLRLIGIFTIIVLFMFTIILCLNIQSLFWRVLYFYEGWGYYTSFVTSFMVFYIPFVVMSAVFFILRIKTRKQQIEWLKQNGHDEETIRKLMNNLD